MQKEVENYILMDKIGAGQYGSVYRAEHKVDPGLFAVKVMNLDKFKDAPKLQEFTNNEVSILNKIDHPHIIKLIEVLKTSTHFFLVYEFCDEGTLEEHIKKRGTIPENEALSIFYSMREAFIVLFKANILHRDLKPSNILFKNGVLKIADFGFCKELLKENDMTQTMVGSPVYMAPEVLKG
jgi:serine/threonine protein kinase